jgi:hypothetical protein
MAEVTEKWTLNQRRVQEWCATPRYDRVPPTQEMLAEQIGIGDRTITRWRQQKGWQEAVNAVARAQVGVKLPEVYGALLREAEKGSFQHIQLALELVGDYVKVQRSEVTGKDGGPIETLAAVTIYLPSNGRDDAAGGG